LLDEASYGEVMPEDFSTVRPGDPCPVSIVLLAHNEAEVIESVVRGFYDKVVSKLPGSEIIVAEDGSTDGTKEILARLIQTVPGLRWEEGKEKRGYVSAFKKAMTLPVNDLVVFCDSSGKHDPDDVWPMYRMMSDYDMVLGYKVNRADPLYRNVMSAVFNKLVNTYFSVGFKDIDCPLRIFRKSAFLDIAAMHWYERALINFELTLRFHYRGYKVAQIPVRHFARQFGESRGLPLKKIPRVIVNTLRNFSMIKADITRPQFRKVA
jgi:glycosyltransferase involved in cell wall biosynthesis